MTKFQLDRAAAVPGGRNEHECHQDGDEADDCRRSTLITLQAAIVARRDESNHNEKKQASSHAQHPTSDGGRTVARKVLTRAETDMSDGDGSAPQSALAADIIIENAPDPVFVADLDGRFSRPTKPSQLLGFRQDEVVEQSSHASLARRETRSSPPRSARSSSAASRATRAESAQRLGR